MTQKHQNTIALESAAADPGSSHIRHNAAFLLNPTNLINTTESQALSNPLTIPNYNFDGDYDFGFPEFERQAHIDNDTGPTTDRNSAVADNGEDSSVGRRTGRTSKWIGGYKYTRINKNMSKVCYRCSHYRSTRCKGKCEFVFDLATYRKFVPHTCGRSALPDDGNIIGPSVETDVTATLKREVDRLAITTTANRAIIWDIVRAKDYGNPNTNVAISGLSREEVLRHVNRARSEEFGGLVYGQIEVSPWSRVQVGDGTPSETIFLLFHYSFYDRQTKERQRLLGWAHPVLLNMLKHKKTDVFVDGTFRCAPPKFKQCVIFSTYDRPTRSYYPAAFVLCSSKKYETYFHATRLVLDETDYAMDPEFMYCDFEAGLIRAIKDHFPQASAVGCLFHFKQACRRKMKEYGIPDHECSIAMRHGVLDMLTVVKQDKVKKQGLNWVKTKIATECDQAGLVLSEAKFPPKLCNVEPYSKATVSRINNPLERFNREMNAAFQAPHPNLPDFVVGIEKLARRYANLKIDIELGRAKTPKRLPIKLPKPVNLPETDPTSVSCSSGEGEMISNEEDLENVLRPDQRRNVVLRSQGPSIIRVEDFGRLPEQTGYYGEAAALNLSSDSNE